MTVQDAADSAAMPLPLRSMNIRAGYLGQTLADVVAITSPEAIILFGGLAKAPGRPHPGRRRTGTWKRLIAGHL